MSRASEVGADAEDVPVRVADVEFADAPWLVCRGMGDVEAVGDAALVDGVDVVHPDRHPDTFIGGFIAALSKCGGVTAAAPTALPALAEKDLVITGTDASKIRRIAPVPALLPTQFGEPIETFLDVRDV